MAPFWFRFYQFLVLYIEKISFLKILCYGPEVVGFQTKVILDLWGMTFHAVVIIALVLALLLESISAYCVVALAEIWFYKKNIWPHKFILTWST